MVEENIETMTDKQYQSLKECINELKEEVQSLNEAMRSVQIWITGDETVESSGTAHTIKRLEKQVGEHEIFINKFKAALAILSVVCGVLGFAIGILIEII